MATKKPTSPVKPTALKTPKSTDLSVQKSPVKPTALKTPKSTDLSVQKSPVKPTVEEVEKKPVSRRERQAEAKKRRKVEYRKNLESLPGNEE